MPPGHHHAKNLAPPGRLPVVPPGHPAPSVLQHTASYHSPGHPPFPRVILCMVQGSHIHDSKDHFFTHKTESPWPLHFKHWWSRWSKFASTLRLRDPWSMWVQDGCNVYMDSYMASNGSWVMVTWTIFKFHLLEVGLTQNHRETWHSEHSYLFYSIMCEDLHDRNSLK